MPSSPGTPPPLAPEAHLAALARDGALLLAAADRAGWDAPVPGLAWRVGEVVVHTGAVHRWAADIVRRALPTNETGGSIAFHPDLPDAGVHGGVGIHGWYVDGLAALVDTLRAAPADLGAWTFARAASPKAFWCRRQAHETAVHRADVEAAAGGDTAGGVTPFAASFAQDGLGELLAGFAGERGFATVGTGRLRFAASDGDDWVVTFGGPRTTASTAPDDGPIDATVTGTSSDLYRWAWNRPSPAWVDGDPRVVELWRRVRIE